MKFGTIRQRAAASQNLYMSPKVRQPYIGRPELGNNFAISFNRRQLHRTSRTNKVDNAPARTDSVIVLPTYSSARAQLSKILTPNDSLLAY